MAITYGVTPQGFVTKRQQDIIAGIQSDLTLAFGQNINLLPESVFGQFVGVFSNPLALLWELADAVYASQYPSGAEGASVDNILALNGLTRLPATPSITSPEQAGVPGLVLLGTPGTFIPAGSLISVEGSPSSQFSIDSPGFTILAAVNTVQGIFFSSTPTQGVFTLQIVDANQQILTSGNLTWQTQAAISSVTFSGVPTTGAFKLSLTALGITQTMATSLTFAQGAATLQTIIQALPGYAGVTVTGSYGAGFTFNWGSITQPILTLFSNTLDATPTMNDSVQAAIVNLFDSDASNYPYTDVLVTGTFGSSFSVAFGTGTLVVPNPASGAQAQNDFTAPTNTLQMGITVTNILVQTTNAGSPAQVAASATATQTGPIPALAGTLNVIDTPVAGWTAVNNPLDVIPGTNVETDTEALARRSLLLSSEANGPLQSIVQKVSELSNVQSAIGFENLSNAANQVLTFSAVPTSGAFGLNVNSLITASIPFSATSATVQTAIQALSGYADTTVTGSFLTGFVIDFNGSNGGQPQPLITLAANTLSNGLGITITPSFGLPGHAIEIVVEGGNNTEIAQAIYASKPAGIETYGSVSITIDDAQGQPHVIHFSRPTSVFFYVTISLVTNSDFNPGSISTIQNDIVTIGNAFPIGSIVIGFGTNGLIGAFNDVPGIVSYTLFFDRSPSPTTNTNVQLQPEEVPNFQSFNVLISYT